MSPGEPGQSALGIIVVYPALLGLYGDRGNALILAHRASGRGFEANIIDVDPGEPVPTSGDIYLVGGAEDHAQIAAADLLRQDGGLTKATNRGAVVLGICAGFQLLGESFLTEDKTIDGVGLIDATTSRGDPRSVGEISAQPTDAKLPTLTGFENHSGHTSLGPDATPLGYVTNGVGNGTTDRAEGAMSGRILCSYMHGPMLARNPAVADLILSWALQTDLAPLDDTLIDQLRADRLGSYAKKTWRRPHDDRRHGSFSAGVQRLWPDRTRRP